MHFIVIFNPVEPFIVNWKRCKILLELSFVSKQVKFLDLSSEPDFTMKFAMATQFPSVN